MKNLPFDEKQIALCEHAAKVEECFADDGTADAHLIAEILAAGYLRKTRSRKTPYVFTEAGCIAVALWNEYHSLRNTALASQPLTDVIAERGKEVTALADIAAERKRQAEVEGWTPEQDDEHTDGDMALAAASYAATDRFPTYAESMWPWSRLWWKPSDRRRDLVKAAALLVAEIEWLDRARAQKEK